MDNVPFLKDGHRVEKVVLKNGEAYEVLVPEEIGKHSNLSPAQQVVSCYQERTMEDVVRILISDKENVRKVA